MELSCSTAARLIPHSPSYNLPTKKPSFPSLSSSSSLFLSAGVNKGLKSSASVRRTSGGGGGPARGRRVGTCRCLFGLGVPEMVVIAGVAALVFGPRQLPEIGRSIGKTVKSFQQAAKEFESELKKDPEDGSQTPSSEGLTAVGSEEKKKELQTSDTKEII